MSRVIAPTLTILAAAFLTACGGGGAESANNAAAEVAANEPVTEAAAANEAAPVVPATAEVGGAPTADYMVGKWSAIEEDCSDTLEFRKDGSLTTPIGEAKWTLVGDKMTMDYGDGSKQPASTLKVVSQDRIEITTGGGRTEFSKRC
jgi:hypothetical protein